MFLSKEAEMAQVNHNNGKSNPTLSTAMFESRLQAFIADVNKVLQVDPQTSRARFPEFKLINEIRSKVTAAVNAYRVDYDLGKAMELLVSAEKHFQNC